MADKHITPEEGLRMLNELFGSRGTPEVKRRCRWYVLELEGGALIFRPLGTTQSPRSELELMFDEICAEEFGDDIVPRKLAEMFPGSGNRVPRSLGSSIFDCRPPHASW
jgi:hypothetical protein